MEVGVEVRWQGWVMEVGWRGWVMEVGDEVCVCKAG